MHIIEFWIKNQSIELIIISAQKFCWKIPKRLAFTSKFRIRTASRIFKSIEIDLLSQNQDNAFVETYKSTYT